MPFLSNPVSVHTGTNTYTIPLHLPPKILNSAADHETKIFLMTQKEVTQKLSPVKMLPDYASAVLLHCP
jgi:hypothetical protein